MKKRYVVILAAFYLGFARDTQAQTFDNEAMKAVAAKYSQWCQYATEDMRHTAASLVGLQQYGTEALNRGNVAEACSINFSSIQSLMNFTEEANNCALTLRGIKDSDAIMLQSSMNVMADAALKLQKKLLTVRRLCVADR